MKANMTSIPRSYNEMCKVDGAFIRSLLRCNKGDSDHLDEVYQHVVLKLLEADVLGKFSRMVEAKMPLTMTAADACAYLGIKFPQWRSRQYAYRFGVKKAGWEKPWKAKWAPEPVDPQGVVLEGGKGYAGRMTRYLTLDVERLREEKGFRKQHTVPQAGEGPVITAAQWRGYLKRAVHNHWANYCRTQSRRHKERPVDRFAEFRSKGEEGPDWTLEATLPYEDQIEARVDLARLERQGGEGFLDMVEGGYTGMEALEKLGVRVPGKMRQEIGTRMARG